MSNVLPRPLTKSEALAQAHEWGHSYSHWNEFVDLESQNEGIQRQETMLRTLIADTVEVQRLVALWEMLPDDLPDQDLSDAGDRINELQEALLLLCVARAPAVSRDESEEEQQIIEGFYRRGMLRRRLGHLARPSVAP